MNHQRYTRKLIKRKMLISDTLGLSTWKYLIQRCRTRLYNWSEYET